MSTSFVVLKFAGQMEELLNPEVVDCLPVLGTCDEVCARIREVYPLLVWHESPFEGLREVLWADTEIDGLRLEFHINKGSTVRHFSVTIHGGGDRAAAVMAIGRATGWNAIDTSMGKFVC